MYLPFSPGIDRLRFQEDFTAEFHVAHLENGRRMFFIDRSRLMMEKKVGKRKVITFSCEFHKIVAIRFLIKISDISRRDVLSDYRVMNFFHILGIILNKYIHVLDKNSTVDCDNKLFKYIKYIILKIIQDPEIR